QAGGGPMRRASHAVALAACVLGLRPVLSQSPGLVVRDVTVISPERSVPLAHAYVRIVDGRIAEVSRRPVKGERELDGTGKFLIPGLIDSHVHLFQVPAMTLVQEAAVPALAAATRAQEPRSYLFFGFTTVIDLNSRPERM